MSVIVSNLDSVVFSIPLLGFLFSVFFRVNDLVRQPVNPALHRCHTVGSDRNGMPLSIDPDGRLRGRVRKVS
jgi:hypothetical protein